MQHTHTCITYKCIICTQCHETWRYSLLCQLTKNVPYQETCYWWSNVDIFYSQWHYKGISTDQVVPARDHAIKYFCKNRCQCEWQASVSNKHLCGDYILQYYLHKDQTFHTPSSPLTVQRSWSSLADQYEGCKHLEHTWRGRPTSELIASYLSLSLALYALVPDYWHAGTSAIFQPLPRDQP